MSNNSSNNINSLSNDAFLRASTANKRLSLLGHEFKDNIGGIILNEKTGETLEKIFKKYSEKAKTIYSSSKYKLNLKSLLSDSLEFKTDNILIEEKNDNIIFQGADYKEGLKKGKEEKSNITEEEKTSKKNMVNDLFNSIDKSDKKERNQLDELYGLLEETENENVPENPDNKKKERETRGSRVTNNETNTFRVSTLFSDICDFNKQEPNINKRRFKDTIFNVLDTIDETEEQNNENNDEKINENNDENIKDENDKKKEILKEEYYPIDVIEEAEKNYNISIDSKEDLYPLNTYQKNNGLTIDFIKLADININSQEINHLSAIGIDRGIEQTNGNNIYACSKLGKIFKMKNNNEISILKDKHEFRIICLDIFENNLVAGDDCGNIIICTNNNVNKVLTNLNEQQKILCVKIVESRNNKLFVFFSDVKGDLYLIKISLEKYTVYKKEKILSLKDQPIYNILFLPSKKSDIKEKKKSVYLFLVSFQNISIYSFNFKYIDIDLLTTLKYFYGEKGKFQFDISIGYGFPPIADLNKDKIGLSNLPAASRGSISDSIAINDNENANLFLAASYGKVIQLYRLNIKGNNDISYKIIGYFINDNPILRISFISNSIVMIMADNFNIKLINTYDFVPQVFNSKNELKPTTICLISYKILDVSKCDIVGEEIEISIDNKIFKKFLYTNKIVTIDNFIFIIGQNSNKIYKCYLLSYEEILSILYQNNDFLKSLWLSLIIFNKKTNVLKKQINSNEKYLINTKKSKLNNYLLMFSTKICTDLSNINENLKMLFEFCIETDYFDGLRDIMNILTQNKKIEENIYINLTKYMNNGDLFDIKLNDELLKSYINYYLEGNKKLLLNKVLIKLHYEALSQEEFIKFIGQNGLINPYIYVKIKKIEKGKKDYFYPVKYIDSFFKSHFLMMQDNENIKSKLPPEQLKLYEEKKKKNEIENEKKLGLYKKLIIEHNLDYLNEDTFSCHEYMGHKLLWYCNKCLSGKEYPSDNPISPISFNETAIEILAFLLQEENIKIYLEFDSYTYLKIIKKYFLEPKLFKLINEIRNENLSSSAKEILDEYLGENNFNSLNGDYIYKSIKNVVFKNIILNSFYVKYDFYIMTGEISSKSNNLFFEKDAIMDVLLFFSDFDVEALDGEKDPYNCHRKLTTEKEKINYYKKIEEYMMNLINYLKEHNILEEKFVKKLLSKYTIKKFKKLYFYLCEEDKRFEECFDMKLDEYERNPNIFTGKKRKDFFEWIEHIIELTYSLDVINEKLYGSNKQQEKYHENFKKLLLNHLKVLCEISVDELSKIADNWFFDEKEQEDLINHLGGGNTNALQLRYIEHYLSLKSKDINDNIEKYLKFLEIEIDLLIKERNKERIKDILTEFKILCNENMLKKLKENNLNDCAIYICQVRKEVQEGIELALSEIDQKYNNLLDILDKPHYNPILIDIELKEMYRYFEKGLNVCQNKFEDQPQYTDIDESWLSLFKKACFYKIDFNPRYENNKNNIKTMDHKKILIGLQKCIQLNLETMSDCINLESLVDIISKNVEKGKAIQFYTFLSNTFYSKGKSQVIYQCGKNMMTSTIIFRYDSLGDLNTKGKNLYLNTNKCNYCNKLIMKNSYSLKIFNCGHIYHLRCCAKENFENVCYLCEKQMGNIEDLNIEKFNDFVSEEERNNQKEVEKKREQESKKNILKRRLAILKNMRIKRREINSNLNETVN